MIRTLARGLVCACLAGGIATICVAQKYTPPPPPLTTLPPCPLDKNGKPIKPKKNQKPCDPTIYPVEAVKNNAVAPPSAPAPAIGAPVTSATATPSEKFPYPGERGVDKPLTPESTPAQRFPYPGETRPAAPVTDTSTAKKFPYPGDSAPTTPAAPPEVPTSKKFPYPGDPAPSAATPAESSSSSSDTSDTAASPSSDQAASSSSDSATPPAVGPNSAPRNPDDDDDTDPPKPKTNSGRRVMKVTKPQSDDDRVDEDLRVAEYYGQSGNSMGAYLRAKDAVKTQPDFADGHFALGEAAKRLKKHDEAVAEYKSYLKLSPDGPKAGAAEKALDDLK